MTEGEKTLVVDDDTRLRCLLERFLGEQGYRVRAVEDTGRADRLLFRELFQPVMLSLMLPNESGLTTCHRLYKQNSQVPIVMFTARGDEGSCIQGLELGTSDYLAKPFNPRKLLARIKAVLRRQVPPVPDVPAGADGVMTSNDYQLFFATRELKKDDRIHMLVAGKPAVPKAPAQYAHEPLTRDRLINLTRGHEWDALERSINVQVLRLCRLIEPDPSKPRCIQMAWGIGHVFVPDGNARRA